MARMRLQVIGNIGADAEVNNEKKYVSFSVAGDTYKEKTTWVTCFLAFKDELPKVAEFLKKGAAVVVDGKPSINLYEGKASLNLNVEYHGITLVAKPQKKEE